MQPNVALQWWIDLQCVCVCVCVLASGKSDFLWSVFMMLVMAVNFMTPQRTNTPSYHSLTLCHRPPPNTHTHLHTHTHTHTVPQLSIRCTDMSRGVCFTGKTGHYVELSVGTSAQRNDYWSEGRDTFLQAIPGRFETKHLDHKSQIIML